MQQIATWKGQTSRVKNQHPKTWKTLNSTKQQSRTLYHLAKCTKKTSKIIKDRHLIAEVSLASSATRQHMSDIIRLTEHEKTFSFKSPLLTEDTEAQRDLKNGGTILWEYTWSHLDARPCQTLYNFPVYLLTMTSDFCLPRAWRQSEVVNPSVAAMLLQSRYIRLWECLAPGGLQWLPYCDKLHCFGMLISSTAELDIIVIVRGTAAATSNTLVAWQILAMLDADNWSNMV